MKLGDILWQAVMSTYGIEVAVSDIEAFKRRFYVERNRARDAGNFEFDSLQLISPPPDVEGKLWIVKKGGLDGKAEGEIHKTI